MRSKPRCTRRERARSSLARNARDSLQKPQEALRRRGRRRRARPHRRDGRVLRPARTQWSGEDDHHRDPRRVDTPRRRGGRGPGNAVGHRPRLRAAAAAGDPAAGDPTRRQTHRRGDPTPVRQLLPRFAGRGRRAGACGTRGEAEVLGEQAVGRAEAAARGGVRARESSRCWRCSNAAARSSRCSLRITRPSRTCSCRPRGGTCAMRDHPLAQLTLPRLREFYREPEAIQRARGRADPLLARDERVTEPGSRYIDFLIPGLLGMNLMGSGLWGVGFSVVQARTKRLLKRFMATPMRKSHYLLSFVLSRLTFLFVEVAALVGFGWWIFDVGVRGSVAALAGITILGSLSFAGLGMLVASRARTIEAVSGLMNLVMLPMWILSGTFFSYARFPDAMQPLVRALPLTALNDALRAVMIDGAPLVHLGAPLGVVTAWGALSFAVALRIFRWR